MTKLECTCPTVPGVFGHSAQCPTSQGLNVNPEVLELAAEAQSYSWRPSPGPTRDMPNPTDADMESPEFEAIWNVIKYWDINDPNYYTGYCAANGSHVMLILNALRQQQSTDINRLIGWLRSNTKIDAREDNAIDAAINLLETARLMVEHLTPAVTHILKSALDALRSAGVDVGELGKNRS